MGSSHPIGIPRHIHREVSSSGPSSGQQESRYILGASRQSTDKVLRYHESLRVRPALYQGLAQLNLSLTYWQ